MRELPSRDLLGDLPLSSLPALSDGNRLLVDSWLCNPVVSSHTPSSRWFCRIWAHYISGLKAIIVIQQTHLILKRANSDLQFQPVFNFWIQSVTFFTTFNTDMVIYEIAPRCTKRYINITKIQTFIVGCLDNKWKQTTETIQPLIIIINPSRAVDKNRSMLFSLRLPLGAFTKI